MLSYGSTSKSVSTFATSSEFSAKYGFQLRDSLKF